MRLQFRCLPRAASAPCRARWFALAAILVGVLPLYAGDGSEPAAVMDLARWPFYQEIALPAAPGTGQYCDVILPPSVFDKSRLDLGDLRLCDASGAEVRYALRIRRPEMRDEKFQAREFNRTTGADKSIELSLDLEANPQQHNQVEVDSPGIDFRRRVELDGSDDGQKWGRLAEGDLIHFKTDKGEFNDQQLKYKPSRFRYLRVRVFPDPAVDHEALEIADVSVHRSVETPGELVTLPVKIEPRQPTRTPTGPGSAWIFDLGADRVPCERIDVDVAEEDFARAYLVEAAGRSDGLRGADEASPDPAANGAPSTYASPDYSADNSSAASDDRYAIEAAGSFSYLTNGLWQRLAGEKREPLAAKFAEARASRLRLKVTDNRNAPLELREVTYTAPARQLVFALAPDLKGPLRLYYGNPHGTALHYDMERNLPAVLNPPPERLTLGPREANAEYVPPPKPLTERLPWLIYVVLGAASAGLGLILVNLGRAAIAQHDAAQPAKVGK